MKNIMPYNHAIVQKSAEFLVRKLLVARLRDGLSFCFMLLIVPIFYYFETFIVLPTFHEVFSFFYFVFFALFTFAVTNILSNLCFIYFTDSSIERFQMEFPLQAMLSWKHCERCRRTVPPRAFHCKTCDTCILKRDHHCRITAYCIGHYNHRYFLMFSLYMALSAVFTIFYNGLYLYMIGELNDLTGLVGFVFPPVTLMSIKNGWICASEFYYSLIMFVNLFGVFVSVLLFTYHSYSMITGSVVHERKENVRSYDTGSLLRNIQVVLGNRWYLTWISPFVTSELPCEGFDWQPPKQK